MKVLCLLENLIKLVQLLLLRYKMEEYTETNIETSPFLAVCLRSAMHRHDKPYIFGVQYSSARQRPHCLDDDLVPLKCSDIFLRHLESLLVLASFEPFAIFAMTLLSSLVDGFWRQILGV